MKRIRLKPFLILLTFLLFVLSFSENFSEGLRSVSVSALSPVWRGVHRVKKGKEPQGLRGKLEELTIENELLKSQIENLKEWIVSEGRREEELNRLLWLKGQEGQEDEEKSFYHRRAQELSKRIEMQMQAVPAKVIFREPISWSSSLWLNVGKRDNDILGREIIAIDSPVVVGACLVGVVEQVQQTKCRVRLITDSGLVPSVRALRGGEHSRVLSDQLTALKMTLEVQNELQGSSSLEKEILNLIERMRTEWIETCESAFLAKGELSGSSTPLWRSRGNLLRGVGFNYDFSDGEGPARNLRSGASLDGTCGPALLLRGGDLLVTTGFDGVFPPGLHVARVIEIGRLREGASSYDLTAEPLVPNLDHLETVFVLPPIEKP